MSFASRALLFKHLYWFWVIGPEGVWGRYSFDDSQVEVYEVERTGLRSPWLEREGSSLSCYFWFNILCIKF